MLAPLSVVLRVESVHHASHDCALIASHLQASEPVNQAVVDVADEEDGVHDELLFLGKRDEADPTCYEEEHVGDYLGVSKYLQAQELLD